jgi:hypothetical protein
MNEDQLKTYYTNLDLDYDNITLVIKEIYCLNFTIDYIVVSKNEFFIRTKNSKSKRTLNGRVFFGFRGMVIWQRILFPIDD